MNKENTKPNTPSRTSGQVKPGYKKTTVGIIPEDWEVKKLGEIGTVINGLTYSPDDIRDKGTLVLRSSNVQNGALSFDDNVYVDISDLKFNPVKKNDILICVRNGSKSLIGKNALITSQVEGEAFGAFMSIYRSEINEYIFQFFGTDEYQRQINQNLGATINSINNNELRQFKLPIPPLPEQKSIADCLSTWDSGIEKLTQLIQAKKQQKKGLMQQLLTGSLRLRSASGEKFDEEWKEVRLKQVSDIIMGVSPNSVNYNSKGQGKFLIQGNADIKNRKSAPRQYTSEITKECKIGDILMSVRAPVGEIAKSIHNACIGRGICSIRSNTKSNNEFLYYYLLKTEILWTRFKQGSTFESVNSTDIKNFSIAIPSLEEQTAVAEILQVADKEIELLEQKLLAMQEQKKGLMQVLLTGEKRLVN